MTVSTPCKRCGELITAEGDDDLVAQVQAHAREHGGAHGTHVPSPARILAHVERQDPRHP